MGSAGSTGDREAVWSRWRRPLPTRAQRRVDVWIALATMAGAMVMTVLVNSLGAFAWDDAPALAEQLAWVVALTAPLVVRRRYPLAVLIVISALFIGAQVRHVGDNTVQAVVLFLAIYTAGGWIGNRVVARWARIAVIAVMLGWLGIAVVRAMAEPTPPFADAAGPLDPVLAFVLYPIVINLVFLLSAYFFGNMAWLSARRQAELERRAEQLRESQEQNLRGAVVAERVRIARDLHDVVAHHVSVMGIQAAAARRVLDTDPELARDALRTVEQTARSAIGELRDLLGVLRAEDADVPAEAHLSSPGLDQLTELVTAARSAGLEVDHGVYGDPRPLPQGVALSAYRVVQEALTNIVKHSDARRADVRLRYLENALEVEVTDDGRGAAARRPNGSGLGLLGMRERVAVHGGVLEAGPRRDNGFRVRASLPTAARSSTEDGAGT
ncbi:MAG TPA: sensor histidine kinase [Actinophytocola sp.]|uniref:sensor histidine kinase n=1 Tax=Actinophytocola sp. TaxID=1872138 RepID=UPI002DB88760|nr:sensor histidine kinase [Actinophytocola sp.]HEU5472949.1 sensor histidine kinase [Actinophytocola sp.]